MRILEVESCFRGVGQRGNESLSSEGEKEAGPSPAAPLLSD